MIPAARCANLWALALGATAVVLWSGCRSGGDEIDFNRDVRPILNQRCANCHGGVRRQAGLSLLFRSDALEPAESGRPAIVPGDSGASELIRRVAHNDSRERMPRDDHALSPEHIDILRRWIDQGAPWEAHWAYVAPVATALPSVSATTWPSNGIDRFVLARLEQEGLSPSAPADCHTLVRRVSLDLTGLPSDPDVMERVCADGSVEAYEGLVDRLLASPRYGERWTSMWLDLARYADSQGFEKDGPRTIWAYRDWVIRAFNDDLSFDRFTIEQLAGDLLPDVTEQQRIATAFHRNTTTNDEGGTDDEEYRVNAVIDRVNTTWEVWQGTTIGCVQCHGHPYDPFRHDDYYSLLAFFNNTADWDQADERPNLVTFTPEHHDAGEALLLQIGAIERERELHASSAEMVAARRAWEARLHEPDVAGRIQLTAQNELLRIARLDETDRDDAQRAFARQIFAAVSDDPVLVQLRERLVGLREQLDELDPLSTPVMQEVAEDRRRTTWVFERGSFLAPTRRVQPGVPPSMPALGEMARSDRLGLARWLVDAANPLTARVTVNRFWEQLFGTGIVETLEDFGTQGSPPSHPELLDWLARQFVDEHGWSMKSLLRQIVMSSTYRQASTVSPELRERDPNNRLLARGPRFRLTAEQIRDQALAVSGLLDETMFGPSVMPPQPPDLWQVPYSLMRWETAEDGDRYRRALYTYWRRSIPYPSMVTLDSPTRSFCVSRRVRTNTPLQALVTLNDPAFVEAAEALADRMLGAGASQGVERGPQDWIRAGYRLALGREPDPGRLAVLTGLYDDADEVYRDSADRRHAALTIVASTILNLDSFLTKE